MILIGANVVQQQK